MTDLATEATHDSPQRMRELHSYVHLFIEMFDTHIANHPAAMHHFNLAAEGHRLLADLQAFQAQVEETGAALSD